MPMERRNYIMSMPPPMPEPLFLFFRFVGDDRFRGQEHRRNGSRVLQGGTGHFRRIDDSRFDHVDPLAGRALKPMPTSSFFRRSTTTEPSCPALKAI